MRKYLFALMAVCLLLSACTIPEEDAAPTAQMKLEQEVGASNEIIGVVEHITDGDTFNVRLAADYLVRGMKLSEGDIIPIRLLLVDTPESVGEKAGMPFGDEASSFAKELLQGETVTLEFDEGDIQDHYDRFLAYAYVDGKRVQDSLVENGYAMIRYVSEPNTRYLDELKSLESDARLNELGIWSLPDYVQLEKGFNETLSNANISGIGENVKEHAKDAAEEFIDESLDSLFDSFGSE